ncbi:MAG: hypothetical protein GXP62_06355, partial [Oligoflexia bacterium]|nr:hypothetical protein [Oligoflexia bacterium]
MIPALLTGALLAATALSAPAKAETFRLDRIEFLSDDTGMWLNYDLPMVRVHPLTTGLRLIGQTQLVWTLPLDNLLLGTSIDSQSVTYERGFKVDIAGGDLGWYGGISMRLFLPRGLTAGVAWQTKHWRLAAGTAASTAATWRRPSMKVWTVVPTISVALVTGHGEGGGKRFRGEPVDRSQLRTDSVPPGMPEEPGTATEPGTETVIEQAPAEQAPVEQAP